MSVTKLWDKIQHVLETNGVEEDLDGMAILMNSAADANLYTGRYLRAVIEGRATLSSQFLLHSQRAFGWTDEEMEVIRAEMFNIGQRIVDPESAPPPCDSPIRSRIIGELTTAGSLLFLVLPHGAIA